MRKKVNKKVHHLTRADIKKNPNIEKEHVITKIKKHERLYTFYAVMIFIVILLGITLLIGTSFKHILSFNSYDSGNLSVEYNSKNNVIGNIITLTDADIVEDAKIKDNDTYNFTITNTSKIPIKYKITIYKDKEFIKLDNCSDRLFKDTEIKYNLNKGSIFYLNSKKVNNYYLLSEDVIPANASKIYSLNIWVDKNTTMSDKHYHGIIEVNVTR